MTQKAKNFWSAVHPRHVRDKIVSELQTFLPYMNCGAKMSTPSFFNWFSYSSVPFMFQEAAKWQLRHLKLQLGRIILMKGGTKERNSKRLKRRGRCGCSSSKGHLFCLAGKTEIEWHAGNGPAQKASQCPCYCDTQCQSLAQAFRLQQS